MSDISLTSFDDCSNDMSEYERLVGIQINEYPENIYTCDDDGRVIDDEDTVNVGKKKLQILLFVNVGKVTKNANVLGVDHRSLRGKHKLPRKTGPDC